MLLAKKYDFKIYLFLIFFFSIPAFTKFNTVVYFALIKIVGLLQKYEFPAKNKTRASQ